MTNMYCRLKNRFRFHGIYLLAMICWACSTDDLNMYNRIRILRDSTLQKEFIFDDDATLKYEVDYVGRNGYEKREYHYLDSKQVDFILVFNQEKIPIREEYYFYDTDGTLVKIVMALHTEELMIDVDYGYAEGVFALQSLDTLTLKKIIYDDSPSRQLWAWYGGTYTIDELDGRGNVTDFYWGYTRILTSYDDHTNPLYKFKDSRPLPIRMSPNNVSHIKSIFIGQGAYALNWAADITYSYNPDGTPQSATWNFDFPKGRIATYTYIYDIVGY